MLLVSVEDAPTHIAGGVHNSLNSNLFAIHGIEHQPALNDKESRTGVNIRSSRACQGMAFQRRDSLFDLSEGIISPYVAA